MTLRQKVVFSGPFEDPLVFILLRICWVAPVFQSIPLDYCVFDALFSSIDPTICVLFFSNAENE